MSKSLKAPKFPRDEIYIILTVRLRIKSVEKKKKVVVEGGVVGRVHVSVTAVGRSGLAEGASGKRFLHPV